MLRFPHFPQKLDVANKQFLNLKFLFSIFHFTYFSSVPDFLFFLSLKTKQKNNNKLLLPSSESFLQEEHWHLMSPQSFHLTTPNDFTLSLYLISHFFYVDYLGLLHLSHKHSWNAFVTTSSTQPSSCCIHNILRLLTSLCPFRS